MASLSEIVQAADKLLRIDSVGDSSRAHNGLQVENSGEISRILAAVDACEASIRAAAEVPGTLLVVHHGLFWTGVVPVTGPSYRKLRRLIESDVAVYSAHLPLDCHPRIGNNILLAKAIGLKRPIPFLELEGTPIGMRGTLALTREALLDRVCQAVGGKVHLAPGGPEQVRKVGVVTGGAGNEVARAAAEGLDTFISGEGSHWSYPLAEELGINLIYAGHYATETFGVKALAAFLSETTGLPWDFFDHPTGL